MNKQNEFDNSVNNLSRYDSLESELQFPWETRPNWTTVGLLDHTYSIDVYPEDDNTWTASITPGFNNGGGCYFIATCCKTKDEAMLKSEAWFRKQIKDLLG